MIFIIGFSFGGMLALSVTASLWKMPLISTSVLKENLCCIVLSPPLIGLPMVQEVCAESPQILSTLHSVILQDDFMPRLTMFLDPGNDKICSESLNEDVCSQQKVNYCTLHAVYRIVVYFYCMYEYFFTFH